MATTKTEATAFQPLGDNLEVRREGNSLVIRIPDLDNRGNLSSSGKTIAVATTHGFKQVTDEVYLSINTYVYAHPKGQRMDPIR